MSAQPMTTDISDVDTRKELLKKTICKGATDEQLELFRVVCKQTGLNPFLKQIQPVFRKSRNDHGGWDEIMVIQTTADGYRVIAERTGNYAPGKETVFTYNKEGNLISATACVKKLTRDGTWHEVTATAFWNEYCQKTKEGHPTKFWATMPHVMLSKCAESLALRKAFPAELSGLYTMEEMQNPLSPPDKEEAEQIEAKLSDDQVSEIENLVGEDVGLLNRILKGYKVGSLNDIAETNYKAIVNNLRQRRKVNE